MDGRNAKWLAIVIGCLYWAPAGTFADDASQPAAPSPQSAEWRDHAYLARSPEVQLKQAPDEQAAKMDLSLVGIWLHVKRSEGDWRQVEEGWVRIANLVRDDQAIDYFAAEIKRSETAFAYLARSRAWARAHDFDKAQADVSEALRLDPHSARAYFVRGRIAIDLGQLEAALVAYDRAIGAKRDLDRSIKLDSKSARAYSDRAWLLSHAGEFLLAISDCNAALAIEPRSAPALVERARARRRLDKLSEAIEDYRASLKLDPNQPEARTALTAALTESKTASYGGGAVPDYQPNDLERVRNGNLLDGALKRFAEQAEDAAATERVGTHMEPPESP